jgi:hypothetical protein
MSMGYQVASFIWCQAHSHSFLPLIPAALKANIALSPSPYTPIQTLCIRSLPSHSHLDPHWQADAPLRFDVEEGMAAP